MTASVKNKACLICIDGWGVSPHDDTEGDAIRNAKTPVMDKLSSEYPYLTIGAHGLAVGLPEGLMGNSEVGHLNVGAGRVVYQDIVRIELAVKKNTLAKNPKLLEAFKGSDRVHFLGLVSDGGVHSHIRHLMALVEAAKAYGVPQCFIHFFADGRDTSPKSATTYLRQLLEFLQKINYGTLVDITGRYYAMDRDKRWERVQLAYEGLVAGVGEMVDLSGLEGDKKIDAIIAAVEKRYSQNETDEFLKPLILEQKEGQIRDGDTLLFFNFRSDRMRQITQVFGKIGGSFPFEVKPEFERKNLRITSMTQYKADYPFPVLFEQQKMTNVMGEWLAHLNVPQMHIAETEKYAHVTFFFNGGTETQYHLEERQLIPSPKVATYDLKPEMSAIEVAEAVAAAVKTGKLSNWLVF
jgi:2,3-bisphosphoglycerate-independent phosphoglycerate mutase